MRLMLASAIILTSAALTTLALTAPADAETRKFDFTGFKRIEADAAFRIEFTQAPTYSVTVDSKHDNFDLIVVEKVGDTLRITRPRNGRNVREIEDVVHVSAPDLDALKLNAAISFNAGRLDLDQLKIDAEAAISINIADLRVGALDVDMDAASKLVVGGTCAKLSLNLGAASNVDMQNLKCREADIDAGVASKVHAFASERATAKAGMSSSILVSGRPRDFVKSTDQFGSSVSLAD
jgi:hypothetical protein